MFLFQTCLAPFYFRFGRWVKAEAAALLAALLDFGLRSTRDAAEAAFLPVTSLFFRFTIFIPLIVDICGSS